MYTIVHKNPTVLSHNMHSISYTHQYISHISRKPIRSGRSELYSTNTSGSPYTHVGLSATVRQTRTYRIRFPVASSRNRQGRTFPRDHRRAHGKSWSRSSRSVDFETATRRRTFRPGNRTFRSCYGYERS